MPSSFIDMRELDTDFVREIVQQAGVEWPEGQDAESRLFRFRAQRIVNAAFGRGVASKRKMDEVIGRFFEGDDE